MIDRRGFFGVVAGGLASMCLGRQPVEEIRGGAVWIMSSSEQFGPILMSRVGNPYDFDYHVKVSSNGITNIFCGLVDPSEFEPKYLL